MASHGITGGACADVDQIIYELIKFNQRAKLRELLDCVRTDRSLVFVVETKEVADLLAVYLSEKGLPTTSIHGDRHHSAREEELLDFRT